MKVLVACEFSGVVRRAFREFGHDAWSCDLLQSEDESDHHIKGDVLECLEGSITGVPWRPWDLMICHPPCTYLATSGARWMKDSARQCKQVEAIAFAWKLWNAPIPMICMENPRSVLMTHIGRPHQQIHPWQFGHGERKETFLWLKNLPPLNPTNIVDGREARVHREAPGPERQKNRSRTYTGIAEAMASQWSCQAKAWENRDVARFRPGFERRIAALPSNQGVNNDR